MDKTLNNIGWNNCLGYLLEHLEDFMNSLCGGQYDNFPYDEIQIALKNLMVSDN